MERQKTGIRLRHLQQHTNVSRDLSPSSYRKKIFQNNNKINHILDEKPKNHNLTGNINDNYIDNNLHENKVRQADTIKQSQYEGIISSLKQKTMQLEQKDKIIIFLKQKIEKIEYQNQVYKARAQELQNQIRTYKSIKNNNFQTTINKQQLDLNKKALGQLSSPTFNQIQQKKIVQQAIKPKNIASTSKFSEQSNKYQHGQRQKLFNYGNSFNSRNHQRSYQESNDYYQSRTPFQQNYVADQEQLRDIVSPLMALNDLKQKKVSNISRPKSFKTLPIQDSRQYKFQDLNVSQFEEVEEGFLY